MENNLIEFKINKTEIKNFIKEIKKTDIKYKNDIILYLNNILKNNYISNFNNVEHLKNTIYLIIKYNNNLSFDNVINSFEELYKNNIPLNYSEKDIENFYNLLRNYLAIINHQTINIHEHLLTFTNDIYNTFENKSLAQSIITKLSNITLLKNPTIKQHELLKICVKIQNYIVKSRSYYVDEHQYYANILVFINELNNSQYINNESFIIENEVNKIINNKLNYDEKKLGIYEVNEENIIEEQRKLSLETKRLTNIINDLDKKIFNSVEFNEKQILEFLNQEKQQIIDYQNTLYNNLKNFMDNTKLVDQKIKREVNEEDLMNNFFEFVKSHRINYQITDKENELNKQLDTNFIKRFFKEETHYTQYLLLETKLKEYNPNFSFETDEIKNLDWFNINTIYLIGYEYMADMKQMKTIEFFYNNSIINYLKELLKINKNFVLYHEIKPEIILMIDKETFANSTSELQYVLSKLNTNNNIDFEIIKEYYKIFYACLEKLHMNNVYYRGLYSPEGVKILNLLKEISNTESCLFFIINYLDINGITENKLEIFNDKVINLFDYDYFLTGTNTIYYFYKENMLPYLKQLNEKSFNSRFYLYYNINPEIIKTMSINTLIRFNSYEKQYILKLFDDSFDNDILDYYIKDPEAISCFGATFDSMFSSKTNKTLKNYVLKRQKEFITYILKNKLSEQIHKLSWETLIQNKNLKELIKYLYVGEIEVATFFNMNLNEQYRFLIENRKNIDNMQYLEEKNIESYINRINNSQKTLTKKYTK